MKFGVNSDSIKKTMQRFFGDKENRVIKHEEAFDFIKQAGYDCIDFSFGGFANDMPDDEFYARITELKAYLDKIGLEVSQTHGRCGYPKLTTGQIFERAVKEIKATAILGAKYIVIHPLRTPNSNYEGDKELRRAENKAFFKRLQPYLEQYGVIECIENLFGDDDERKICAPNTCSRPEEILEYLEYLNSDSFAVCFDVGHMLLTCDITGDTVCGAMRKLGKNIKVLHVHDNKKIKDDHVPPFMGALDWKEFALTLKDIDYQGVFSMELVPYRALPNPSKHALLEFYKFAKAVADPEKML